MIVRFCYAVYLQLLNQHNQEFRPYIPDPLSRGARGSGNETTFPDPPVLRAKEGQVRSEFLVVLSQRVWKTGNPIRLLGLKIS